METITDLREDDCIFVMEKENIIRNMDSCISQLGSKQDFIYSFQKDDEWIMALFDGHGSNTTTHPITHITKKYNLTLLALEQLANNKELETILEKDIFSKEDNPAICLQRAFGKVCLDTNQSMKKVGSTMVVVKVKHNKTLKKIIVEVLSIGDSTAVIHDNGKKVIQSTSHTTTNPIEIERLMNEQRIYPENYIQYGNGFEILDENTIAVAKGKYVLVQDVSLALTQSIGHLDLIDKQIMEDCGIFGLDPYKIKMEFPDTDDINIKLFSDGVSDVINPNIIMNDKVFMTNSNATETVNFAEYRWKKHWNVCTKDVWYDELIERQNIEFKVSTFGDFDDISCISWIQHKES